MDHQAELRAPVLAGRDAVAADAAVAVDHREQDFVDAVVQDLDLVAVEMQVHHVLVEPADLAGDVEREAGQAAGDEVLLVILDGFGGGFVAGRVGERRHGEFFDVADVFERALRDLALRVFVDAGPRIAPFVGMFPARLVHLFPSGAEAGVVGSGAAEVTSPRRRQRPRHAFGAGELKRALHDFLRGHLAPLHKRRTYHG